jgi:uncharacterized iron-regulated membrane protein
MTTHRVWLTLHQWIGLAGALFIMIMGFTGSALVFENEIDRALHPSTSYVTPQGQPLPIAELVARANAANSKDPVGGVHIADKPDQAYELSARARRSIFINQYTGEILGVRDREQSVARFLHLLHTRFVAGQIGEWIAGWFTVLMLFLAISGIVLWWPRKIVSVKNGVSWKRTNFDLHNVLGFYSSIVMFFIAFTAVLIAFEGTMDPLVLTLNGRAHGAAAVEPATLQSTPVPGATRIPPDEALRIADQALPGARASNINVPASPRAIYRILAKFPEDRTPAGRSRIYIDQFSGKVLLVENTRTAPLGTRILNLKRSAHTGDIFGAPTQALYFVVSFGVGVQVLTGVLVWWNSRKPQRGATRDVDRESAA